jgi:hypothetical protein
VSMALLTSDGGSPQLLWGNDAAQRPDPSQIRDPKSGDLAAEEKVAWPFLDTQSLILTL